MTAITDKRARERYGRLRDLLVSSTRHMEWLLPFLNAKARESGDVAGLQLNVREHIKEIEGLLRAYDAEDRIEAEKLAAGGL